MEDRQFNTGDAARFITYLCLAVGGVVCVIFGAVRGDFALIGAGAALLGGNSLAAFNTPSKVEVRGRYGEQETY